MSSPPLDPTLLLDAITDAVIAADASNIVRYVNRSVERLLGWKSEEIVGQSLSLLMPERFRHAHLSGMQRHLATGERRILGGPPVRVAALHRDGSEVSIELSLSSAELGGQQLFVATLRDARDRQELERRVADQQRLEAQYRLMALVAQTQALQPVGRELLASICEPLGWDVGVLWRVDRVDDTLRFVEAWTAPQVDAADFIADSTQRTFRAGEGTPGKVLASRRHAWIEDVALDPRYVRGGLAERSGLRGAFLLPVSAGNDVVAIFELLSRSARPPDPELISTLAVLAGQVGQLLARLNAERNSILNEAWLRTLVHSIGDAVIATDARTCVVVLNPVAEALTGWAASDAVGRPLDEVFQVINEETGQRVATPVQEVLRTGNVVALANHSMLVARDGKRTPVEDTAAPIRDEGGAVSGVVLVFRDVSLQRSATRTREFLSEAGRVLSSSLDYQDALSALARLCVPRLADWCSIEIGSDPRSTQQLAVAHVDPTKVEYARELRRRFPPDPNAAQGARHVIRTGKAEYVREIPPGMLDAIAIDDEQRRIVRELGLRSYIVVPLTSQGRVLGALTLVSAESHRLFEAEDVRVAEELAARAGVALENAMLYREATEASRLRDEFLATLSHELRTPLTSILGWTQMLRGGHHRPDSTPKALETIERNAKSLGRLVEDLLDVSRAIRGKLSLDRRPVDLRSVIELAVDTVRPSAEARRIGVTAHVAPTLPMLIADPDRLQQVIWNLLANAVKFSQPDATVEVRAVPVGSEVEITVSDAGEGISPEFLPYIFDRFRQADGTSTRAHGGLGLGLALVKHLVEQHGGTVQARSEGLGRGATFTVRLPRPTQSELWPSRTTN